MAQARHDPVVIAMQNTFGLRNALSEDEGFVLRLEELSLRQHCEINHERFVTRPGMGDEFPGNCQITQHENADVGCLITSMQDDCTHIDHLYLHLDARGLCIDHRVIDSLILNAGKRGQRVQATIPATGDASRFFAAAGFFIVSRTSKTMKIKWPAEPQADMTGGTGNV